MTTTSYMNLALVCSCAHTLIGIIGEVKEWSMKLQVLLDVLLSILGCALGITSSVICLVACLVSSLVCLPLAAGNISQISILGTLLSDCSCTDAAINQNAANRLSEVCE